MSEGFGLRPLYSTNMPVKSQDEDDQAFFDRVRQYDNLIQQNALITQQTLGELYAKIIELQSIISNL